MLLLDVKEGNERFEIYLFNPTDQSQLGNQWRSIVTIIDDDYHSLGVDEIVNITIHEEDSSQPYFQLNNEHNQLHPNESLLVVAENQETYDIYSFVAKPIMLDKRYVYNLDVIEKPGEYSTHVYLIAQGGLKGSYYADPLLSSFEKSRIDAVVNFTWGEDIIKSVRWDGFVQRPNVTEECCTFYVTATNVRLWVDRYLIIDEWDQYHKEQKVFSGYFDLQNNDIVEIMIEVHDANAGPSIKLMWSKRGSIRKVIPSDALFWKVKSLNKFHIYF